MQFINFIRNKIEKYDLQLQDKANQSFKELGEDLINFSRLLVMISFILLPIIPFLPHSLLNWNPKLTLSLLMVLYIAWPIQWLILEVIFKIKRAFQYFLLGLLVVIALGFSPQLFIILDSSLTPYFTQALGLEVSKFGLVNLQFWVIWAIIVIPSFLLLALAKFPIVWIQIKFQKLGYKLRVGKNINLLQAIFLIYGLPFLILKIIHYFLEPFGLFKFLI